MEFSLLIVTTTIGGVGEVEVDGSFSSLTEGYDIEEPELVSVLSEVELLTETKGGTTAGTTGGGIGCGTTGKISSVSLETNRVLLSSHSLR